MSREPEPVTGGPFQVDDVVYALGTSGIYGDVIAVERDDDDPPLEQVTIRWRITETTEDADDLVLVERPVIS